MFRHPKYYKELERLTKKFASSKVTSAQAPKLSNQPTQSSSPQAKGSSFKPKSTSSKIL